MDIQFSEFAECKLYVTLKSDLFDLFRIFKQIISLIKQTNYAHNVPYNGQIMKNEYCNVALT